MYSFPNLELVRCSMSGSNCCFLTCIQISQESDKVVWYSHLLKNFPEFLLIHIVKGFSVVNKAEIDVFQQLELDMEQQTGSKYEKEYSKAVYRHPAYLTYMKNTSCDMLGWMKHKL